jgi:predicted O-methyltransferase YrrM
MASWSRLDAAVKSGNPDNERVSLANDSEVRENFEMGMFDLAMQIAPQLVPQIDLRGRRRLLDLGGGPGTYAIHFCMHNPDLQAVVYDLPTTRPFAEQTIARFGLTDRIAFTAGDFMHEGIQGAYDVAWLSHILHGAGKEGSAVILDKAVAALEKGGVIMVQEFILDDNQCTPLFPALFSLNMLLGTPAGQSFSQSELFAMLAVAGVRELRRLPMDLPNGAGVIAGTIP